MEVTMKIRTYSELRRLETIQERFEYLKLRGRVGDQTFGYDRWINQKFYTSTQWRRIRSDIIARDLGCDLGIEGYDIHSGLYIHHLNPMTRTDIVDGDESILDPEYLITTTLATHNAIHYGDAKQLPRLLVERKPGDTKLW
jgi:hypothetical protein